LRARRGCGAARGRDRAGGPHHPNPQPRRSLHPAHRHRRRRRAQPRNRTNRRSTRMTTLTPAHERPAGGLGAALADTWTITLRDLQHWRNRPGLRIFGWLFPVLMMGMFIGLLGGAIAGASAMAMFLWLPGPLAALSSAASNGVPDGLRSLPVSGVAVAAGRCAAATINSVISLIVVVTAGLTFAWRPDAAAPSIAAAF